jgi:hypothetical protein
MNPKPPQYEIPDLDVSVSSVRSLKQHPALGAEREPNRIGPPTPFEANQQEVASSSKICTLELAEEQDDPRRSGVGPEGRTRSPLPPPSRDPLARITDDALPPKHPLPSSWLTAPAYLWFVYRERARLQGEEEQLSEQLTIAQREHATAVMGLAQLLQTALSDDPRYATLLTEFAAAKEACHRLDDRVEKPIESDSPEGESVDDLPRLQTDLQAAKSEEAEADLCLRRVRARYQRLQIELRAAQSQGETAAARVELIRTEMSQSLETVATAETQLEQAEKVRAAAERTLGTTRLALRRADDRLRTQKQLAARRHPEGGKQQDAAHRQLIEVGRNLCRTVLSSRNRPRIDPTMVEHFRQTEERVRVLLVDQSKVQNARKAVNTGVMRTGWVVVLGLVSLILLLVWLALR